MHRLGFNLKNLENIYIKLKSCAQISSINLISHFACADELENSYNQQQIKQFNTFSPLTIQWRSLANSAAIMSRKESHFDWVRPGIMLYGVSPFSATVLLAKCLKPVMSLSAQIIAIHQFEEGDSIGYGRQWIADKSVRVGVVSCGYADGYPRQVPSGTSVLVRGKRVPLVGCVSMDMLTIDLSTAPEAHVGDLVQLWGEQILVNEIAESVGSIGYEVLSKVTSRVKRCYIS
ncbi:UNVERIFIED_CONTAM: hypothetical protein GTU68_052140 [Idotea baltica]|nr:hypothetical protein [Idotea baltica]